MNFPNEEEDKIRKTADVIKLCEFQDFVREFNFSIFFFKAMTFSFSQVSECMKSLQLLLITFLSLILRMS